MNVIFTPHILCFHAGNGAAFANAAANAFAAGQGIAVANAAANAFAAGNTGAANAFAQVSSSWDAVSTCAEVGVSGSFPCCCDGSSAAAPPQPTS